MLKRLYRRLLGRRAPIPRTDNASLSITESARYWADQHAEGRIPDYEEILAGAYDRFLEPGDTVIDIGVHHGIHFDRFKARVGARGKVIGFEPVPDFIDVVRQRHGPDAALDIRQKALSAEPGTGEFLHMTGAPGESGFKERTSEGKRGAVPIQVEISTLDLELGQEPRVDYIKIDTEGHEISALSGGAETIARCRPIISVEYGKPTYSLYGLTADSLYDWAEANGYLISDLFGCLCNSRDEWHATCDVSYWDFFLVPEEKRAAWESWF